MYDVIVVGAGPAGCIAAGTLASGGLRTLLLERHRLPRNKSCSGVLIKRTLDLIAERYGENVPTDALCTPIENRGMVFTDDRGVEHRFEQPGLNIWRAPFDAWLARKAVQAGAEIREEASVLSIEDAGEGVELLIGGEERYSEMTSFAIVCDGASGSLREKASGERLSRILTYQTFCRGSIRLDPHYFYAYLQPELSEYDAWFNVKDDYLIFGVSTKSGHAGANAYHRAFVNYMAARHEARVDSVAYSEKWVMPHIRPGCPVEYGRGRILFAGESAGFLNPMGEGISCAMQTGHAAATAILEAGPRDGEEVRRRYAEGACLFRQYMENQWGFVGRMAATFAEMI